MDFNLTPRQRLLKDAVREFMKGECDPAVTLELAKKYTDNPVYIIGSGQASDTLALHDRRSLTTLDATVKAAQVAYKQAGISADDVDLAEVHDCFTIAEILAIEDLGFVKKGEGGKAIENKITTNVTVGALAGAVTIAGVSQKR
jgi:acetyl-CoA acetyltransferase